MQGCMVAEEGRGEHLTFCMPTVTAAEKTLTQAGVNTYSLFVPQLHQKVIPIPSTATLALWEAHVVLPDTYLEEQPRTVAYINTNNSCKCRR